jgi:uncharacterized membrane-anchored protein
MALWFFTVAFYTVYKEYGLRAGTEVMLRVVPVDPREIFRGDYVILRYEISEITPQQKVFGSYGGYMEEEALYNGDTVYVTLVKDGAFYKGGDIYKSMPETGLFIKGKIETNQRLFGLIHDRDASISYGIENFFVPEGEGKVIESARNRNKVSAQIAVNSYGSASIKALYIGGRKVDFKNKNEETY